MRQKKIINNMLYNIWVAHFSVPGLFYIAGRGEGFLNRNGIGLIICIAINNRYLRCYL